MIITKLDVDIASEKSESIKAVVYLTDFQFMDKICNRVRIIKKFSLINAVGIEGSKDEILTLTYLPYVKYVSSITKVYSIDNIEEISSKKLLNNNKCGAFDKPYDKSEKMILSNKNKKTVKLGEKIIKENEKCRITESENNHIIDSGTFGNDCACQNIESEKEQEFGYESKELKESDISDIGANFSENAKNKYTYIMNNFYNLNGYSGKGMGVAIIDTGVSRHLDLCSISDRIILQHDVENNETFPYDDNGHGTFVAGVISGNGICSGKKIMGVCPNANVISVKIMNEKGESDIFKALSGMEWVSENYEKYNIKVVVMSFGAVPKTVNDPLVKGVEALTEKGIIVVCASGNSGLNTYMSPAVSSKVISVGAVGENNDVADFTSRGTYEGESYPYVYARGVKVAGLSSNGLYVSMSGTSVACPIVAGFCLLLKEKFPTLSPEQIKQTILQYSKFKDNFYVLDI